MRNTCFAALALLMLFSSPAAAVELGDIDVRSHLDMPFRATVPLSLSGGEAAQELTIGLASPLDYRSLKIHRDPAINMIRIGLRGGLIELSSRTPLQAPYFTLVLKIQSRHATHFRKYPVILDLPHAARATRHANATPTVVVRPVEKLGAEPQAAPMHQPDSAQTEQVQTEMEQPERVQTSRDRATAAEATPPFRPFDGWARTARYGPTVLGDMLRVIADRLRIDERYTVGQVMVALFEKNRSNFAEENLHLPLPGSYFDVPTAAEVERLTQEQAAAVIAGHDRRWQELKKQPRYAAIAEAQKRRYGSRAPDGGDR